MSASSLSYKKFCEYVEKKSFSITCVYALAGETKLCKLFECKTPVAQKTFFVYVPNRYKMILSDRSEESNTIHLIEEIDTPFEKLLNRGRNIKGKLSSDIVILSKVIHVFSINETYFIKIDKEKPKDIRYDPIDDLETRATDIGLGSIGWKYKTLKSSDLDKLPVDGREMRYVKPSKKKEKVKLIFVDEKNMEIANLDSLMEDSNNFREGLETLDIVQTEDNSVPSFLTEREVYSGIVFIALDVNSFFHSKDDLEKTIIEQNNKLDEFERKSLLETVTHVQDLSSKLAHYISVLSKEYIATEESTKSQLLRLTAVLTDTSLTKKRIQGRKKPLRRDTEETKELDSIIETTRRTIHEIQLTRIHQKEKLDSKISDAVSLLSDLIA